MWLPGLGKKTNEKQTNKPKRKQKVEKVATVVVLTEAVGRDQSGWMKETKNTCVANCYCLGGAECSLGYTRAIENKTACQGESSMSRQVRWWGTTSLGSNVHAAGPVRRSEKCFCLLFLVHISAVGKEWKKGVHCRWENHPNVRRWVHVAVKQGSHATTGTGKKETKNERRLIDGETQPHREGKKGLPECTKPFRTTCRLNDLWVRYKSHSAVLGAWSFSLRVS